MTMSTAALLDPVHDGAVASVLLAGSLPHRMRHASGSSPRRRPVLILEVNELLTTLG